MPKETSRSRERRTPGIPTQGPMLAQLAALAAAIAAADDLTAIYRALYRFALATSPSNGLSGAEAGNASSHGFGPSQHAETT